MSNPYVGEIRMFGGTFAPAGWAMCQGQLMAISQNDTLFTLIGTTYGGDGQTTFGIPDLQGRAAVHMGQGPGISQAYQIGEKGGVETVTLNVNQIPIHNHNVTVSQDLANAPSPANQVYAQSTQISMYTQDQASKFFNPSELNPIGGSQPHENMQPYLVITFILSLFGVFPSQN
jgi:microcystin-dependent protein